MTTIYYMTQDGLYYTGDKINEVDLEVPQRPDINYIWNQQTKGWEQISKDLNEELKKILAQIKSVHLDYIATLQMETIMINELTFSLSNTFYVETVARIAKARELGTTLIFSRDYNNKYFLLTVTQVEQILATIAQYKGKLWAMQELSYIKKWTLEQPFKQCTTVAELEALSKNFVIKVTEEEVNELLSITPEERDLYTQQVASNFITV